MKKWIMVFSLMAVVWMAMNAQGKHPKNPELRAALRQHFEQQMYPVLKEKHTQFDAALSPEALAFLNGKRQQAQQIKEQKKALRREAHQYLDAGKTKEEVHALLEPRHQQIRSQMDALAKELQPFIQQNQALVDRFVEELKPYHQQWREQRHALHEQYRPEGAPEHKEHKDRKDCPKPQGQADDRPDHKERAIVRFLLWDGEEPEEHPHHPHPAPKKEGQSGTALVPQAALELYPNPAVDNATLRFSLAEATTQATLKIMDANGRLLRELPLGALPAGTHSQQLNLHDLPAGTYHCVLEAQGKQQTRSLVIQR